MPSLSAADIRNDGRYREACALLNELWRHDFVAHEHRRDFIFFATDRLRKLRAARPQWMNDLEGRNTDAED